MVRLYSNGVDLDLGEFSTTLTFSIADIREPDKRNASFSKTLTLPGTKNNNLFFENAFEIDVVTQTFNPNLKAMTVLSVDGVTQFKGALKLRKVNYLLGGQVTYDCNLIGNLADIYQEMGNLRLRDLDLSAYDHTYDKATIEASWTPTLGTGYVYPMINYGENASLNTWDVGNFRPAVFAKTIFDKIVSDAGYTYSSSFLTSDLFKRLVIPNSQDRLRLSGAQVTAGMFNAGRTIDQDISYTVNNQSEPTLDLTTTIEIDDDSTGSYFDNDGNFSTAQYWYAAAAEAGGHFFLSCNLEGTFVIPATVNGYDEVGIYGVVEIVEDYLGTITSLNTVNFDTSIFSPSVGGGTYSDTALINLAAEGIYIRPSAKYYCRVVAYSNVSPDATSPDDPSLITSTLSISNISFRNISNNTTINIGGTIEVSNTLPDMLQKDFVTGLIRLFNLYIEPDKDDETLLLIEPRNSYYTSTQVDWTPKLATEKDLEIEPMALLNFKRIIAQYKDDGDYYNKIYKQEYTRNYGSYLADIDNDFVNGDYKIETTFSPTPLQGNYENDRIIPAIFEAASGTPPTTNPFGAQPRILYWGGLTNCEEWNFRLFSTNDFKTQFPYAGHLDETTTPTIDLSFGVPQKVYYGVNQFIPSLSYTDNNLYNAYYKQMIEEITDRDSKLVTGYFWLTPVDILNLDFRKIYRVGSHALRLNKIYDYNPVKPNLTKCEFIKIKDVDAFTSASEIMNGGFDIAISSRENAPVIDMSTFQGGNVVARPSTTVITGEKNYAGGGLSTWISGANNRVHGRNSSGVVITGEDNIVQDGASGVVIHGYSNNVGFGAKNLFIQGSQNTIAAGLENVTLVNTSGKTVTESNVSYFNDTKYLRSLNAAALYYAELSIPTASVLTLNSTPLEIVAAPGAGYAIQVISASCSITYNSVAYATNVTLQAITDTATISQAESGLLDATSSQIGILGSIPVIGISDTQIIENKALQVKVKTGNPTAGNSDIKVYVLYRIITL